MRGFIEAENMFPLRYTEACSKVDQVYWKAGGYVEKLWNYECVSRFFSVDNYIADTL
jgi:hypothetical protein